MNGLQTFANEEFGAVRSLMIKDMPWFVGRDVATALGYAKPQNAIKSHVDADDAPNQGIIDSMGRSQPTMLINESGLYSLILSSKLPRRQKVQTLGHVRSVTRHPQDGRVWNGYTSGGAGDSGGGNASGTGDYERRLPPRRVHRRLLQKRALALCAGVPEQGRAFHRLPRADAGRTERDRYEIMRLLVKAYNDYGISDTTIGKATGLNRAQIRMYRTGERFPKAGRAEYIKAVVEPMLVEQE